MVKVLPLSLQQAPAGQDTQSEGRTTCRQALEPLRAGGPAHTTARVSEPGESSRCWWGVSYLQSVVKHTVKRNEMGRAGAAATAIHPSNVLNSTQQGREFLQRLRQMTLSMVCTFSCSPCPGGHPPAPPVPLTELVLLPSHRPEQQSTVNSSLPVVQGPTLCHWLPEALQQGKERAVRRHASPKSKLAIKQSTPSV